MKKEEIRRRYAVLHTIDSNAGMSGMKNGGKQKDILLT